MKLITGKTNLTQDLSEALRKYLLEKENANYSYGCVMIDVDISDKEWETIQSLIDDEDIFEGEQYGREDAPHVTLLYGIHEDVPDEKSFYQFPSHHQPM